MKSLSLSRPLILMVIGVPGSGKSFFARQFSETFNAPIVSQDFVRSQIFVSPHYSREEDEVIQSICTQQIDELLKTEKTFLVDGGLNVRADRLTLAKQAKIAGYGVLTVWIQTDEPTSFTRATKRNSRRQGDLYSSSITEKQFDALMKQLSPPSAQEPYVVISGKHTYATQAKVVLKKLIIPREQQAGSLAPPSHENQVSPPQRRNVIIN